MNESSSRSPEAENNDQARKRKIRNALSAVTLTAVGVIGAPRVGEFLYDINRDDSSISVNVPGQIEDHRYRLIRRGSSQLPTFELLIEQSPQDINTVKNDGSFHGEAHFNPTLGEFNEDAILDWVDVDEETFDKYEDGDTITFNGDSGEVLQRGISGEVLKEE